MQLKKCSLQKCCGVIYSNYIKDDDSKTFKGLIDAQPYGKSVEIHKKKCIGAKTNGYKIPPMCEEKQRFRYLSSNKLTGKLIDKLFIMDLL